MELLQYGQEICRVYINPHALDIICNLSQVHVVTRFIKCRGYWYEYCTGLLQIFLDLVFCAVRECAAIILIVRMGVGYYQDNLLRIGPETHGKNCFDCIQCYLRFVISALGLKRIDLFLEYLGIIGPVCLDGHTVFEGYKSVISINP